MYFISSYTAVNVGLRFLFPFFFLVNNSKKFNGENSSSSCY